MSAPSPLVRLIDELLWVLRREGFEISTAQAIDAARAVAAVGFARRADVRDAVAAVVVHRARDRGRFDDAFDRFFAVDARGAPARTLWERLSARGFDPDELEVLRALMAGACAGGAGGGGVEGLETLAALLERGADFDRALALGGLARDVDGSSEQRLGFLTHRLLSRIGLGEARRALGSLRRVLLDALGTRGEALADALALELERAPDEVRVHARRRHEALVGERLATHQRDRAERRLATIPFTALTDAEIEEVRRSVRRFAETLRGGAQVRRRRRARHGRIDPHRTLRRALGTGGVPFVLVRKERRRDRPKLVLLCDISDSVRAAARFLLEFTYVAQEMFARTRSFVFVSDLGETTELFAREPVAAAVARAWGGGVVSTSDNSNYGRALHAFDAHHARDLDRRTTVVVLGDGRTNYFDPAAEVLARVRERSRALYWVCPEPRSQWGQGDSAMAVYEPACNAVYEVRCAADLEHVARILVARG
jgi:uncharacterized protein with von Willebrand factor type A (vWA) domain